VGVVRLAAVSFVSARDSQQLPGWSQYAGTCRLALASAARRLTVIGPGHGYFGDSWGTGD